MKVQEIINRQEQLGLDVITSFFAQNFTGINYKIVPTQPGERYDADVYIDGRRLMIEFKSRSQKYHPKNVDSLIFDIEKIQFALKNDDRYGYFYFSFYQNCNDLYIWNLDKNVHVNENNKDYMEGMPVFINGLPSNDKNKYGIYWNENMQISICTADVNASTTSRNRLFIPTYLFAGWHYDYGKWTKLK